MNDPERILKRARRRGDLPVSAPLLRAAGLAVVVLAAPWWLNGLWHDARLGLEEALRRITAGAAAPDSRSVLLELPLDTLTHSVLRPVLTLSGFVIGAVLMAGLAQTRGATVDPRRAAARGADGWAPSVVALLLAVGLAAVCAGLVTPHLTLWSTPRGFTEASSLEAFGALLDELAAFSAAVALAVGAFDLGWARARWRQRNALTPAELRREQRQREVAPEVRAAQRALHREVADEGRDPLR